MNEHNIEVAVIGEDKKFRVLTPAEVSCGTLLLTRQMKLEPHVLIE